MTSLKISISLIIAMLLITSCSSSVQETTRVTNPNEYNTFLNTSNSKSLQKAENEVEFWASKLQVTPNQFPYLGKIAAAKTQLFTLTGEIKYLIDAEEKLKKANEVTNYANASYLRALARNYISQHRFQEALQLLEKAKQNGEQLEATHKMLFDVHLELGNYHMANAYLARFKSGASFDYLIRLAKWNDHKGNLSTAIEAMELATTIAEQSGVTSTKIWAYTNLADFYGHDNQLQKSYDYFIKALTLDPANAYAKKGIAWIVYSHEKNPKEALRIISMVQQQYQAPDYFLLKAEIASYMQDMDLQQHSIHNYLRVVKNSSYGMMYNQYNAKLYLEDLNKPIDAMELILKEVEQRATPETYALLAWAFFKNNEPQKALEIAKSKVKDQTFEPEALYYLANIYKANGLQDDVTYIKSALEESDYEIGPVLAAKVAQL